jgi:hypothetical protein
VLVYPPLSRLRRTKLTRRLLTRPAAPSLELHQKGLSIAACSRMSDTLQRDRAKACNVAAVGEPIKAIDAVRRLECDRHACLGDGSVKVASNWMLHRNNTQARLHFAVPSYAVRVALGTQRTYTNETGTLKNSKKISDKTKRQPILPLRPTLS